MNSTLGRAQVVGYVKSAATAVLQYRSYTIDAYMVDDRGAQTENIAYARAMRVAFADAVVSHSRSVVDFDLTRILFEDQLDDVDAALVGLRMELDARVEASNGLVSRLGARLEKLASS